MSSSSTGSTSFTPEVPYEEPSNPIARTLRSVAAAFGVAPPGEKDFIKRVVGVPRPGHLL